MSEPGSHRTPWAAAVASAAFLVLAVLALTVVSNGTQLFCENNSWNSPSSSALLAARAAGRGLISPISDEELRAALEAMRTRAASGEPEAVALLFDLAQRQREAGAAKTK